MILNETNINTINEFGVGVNEPLNIGQYGH